LSVRIAENPFRAATKLHDPLTLEYLREARRAIATYCLKPDSMCKTYIELVRRTSRGIALLRLLDLRSLEGYQGLDQGVLRLLDNIVDIYSKVLAGFLITVGDHVLVRFKATVEVDGRLYRRGDIARLPIDRLVALVVANIVEPIESLATLS